MAKRIISLAMSLVMIFSFVFIANADESSSLEFNESGKFRIMVINDTHDDATTDNRLIKGLQSAVKSEKPDLIVFNGDIFYERFMNPTKEKLFESMHGIFQVVENEKVPFALTFGNHDTQYGVSADELMGYSPLETLPAPDYVEADDAALYPAGEPATNYFNVAKGEFVIFFPQDAHAPAITAVPMKKVIVKVAV
jgi:predicted MPP superfamily phosphohydrolase